MAVTGEQPVSPPDLEAVREAFPQLEVISLIGTGGMGSVFKARQPQLDRLVALKLLTTGQTGDTQFSARFQREAQALARLSHPHIVTIHDFGQAGGFYFLLMEYVDGVNLRQAMAASRLAPEQAIAIVPPICEALQYAHERGIVHHDIKPENLLLDRDGQLKIADFGIARMLGAVDGTIVGASSGQDLTRADALGTPSYMAPEQRTSPQTVDHRADIYSLGVVFYEMLTGELPGSQIEPPSRKVEIDVRLDEIVLRALGASPERRYNTALEFKTQLAGMSEEAASSAAAGSSSSDDTFQMRDDGISAIPNGAKRLIRKAHILNLAGWPAAISFFLLLPSIGKQALWLLAGSIVVFAVSLLLYKHAQNAASSPPELARDERGTINPRGSAGAQPRRIPKIWKLSSHVTAVLLALLCIFAALALTVVLKASPLYLATTSIESHPDTYENVLLGTAPLRDPFFIDVQKQVIRKTAILYPAIDSLKLTDVYDREGLPLTKQQAFLQLNRNLEITEIRNTGLLEIRVYDRDPQLAADIANAIASTYRQEREASVATMNAIRVSEARDELLRGRAVVIKAREEASKIRNEATINDPDPESLTAHVTATGQDSESEAFQVQKYTEAKIKYVHGKRLLEEAERAFAQASLNEGRLPSPVKIWQNAEPPLRPTKITVSRLFQEIGRLLKDTLHGI